MKKRRLKILSFVLSICMIIGITACQSAGSGSAGKEAAEGTTAAVAETTEALAEATEAAAETAEAEAGEEKTGSTGKRVYFAGPLFTDAEKAYNLKLATILEEHGYEVFLPQRDGYLAVELEGKTAEEKTKMIFAKDWNEVKKSDIIFMVLDGRVPDEGACVELGMGYAEGKTCYGIKNDARSVELDMDLNPVIGGCFKKIFYNMNGEELIKELEDYLEKNEL